MRTEEAQELRRQRFRNMETRGKSEDPPPKTAEEDV